MTFEEHLRTHVNHIETVAHLCNNEEITKQALILPFFDLLGFVPFNPSQVKSEYRANLAGIKSSERVDYALFINEKPVMFVEAKSLNSDIKKHSSQLARYFNATIDVSVCAITNGKQWHFYTDLINKNIMDTEPFFKLDLDNLTIEDIQKLYKFHRGNFNADELFKLAQESTLQTNYNNFTSALNKSLIELDNDFIGFIIQKSGMNKMNKDFFENIKPIFKNALDDVLAKKFGEFNLFFELQEIFKPFNIQLNSEYIDDYQIFYIKNDKNMWICKYFGSGKEYRILLPLILNEADINNIELTGLKVVNGYIILNRPIDIIRIAFILISIAKNQ